jgi:hypothetical protein
MYDFKFYQAYMGQKQLVCCMGMHNNVSTSMISMSMILLISFLLEVCNCQFDYYGRERQQVSLSDDKVVYILSFHVVLASLPIVPLGVPSSFVVYECT